MLSPVGFLKFPKFIKKKGTKHDSIIYMFRVNNLIAASVVYCAVHKLKLKIYRGFSEKQHEK